jgi:autotransporter-associated beta strand protein
MNRLAGALVSLCIALVAGPAAAGSPSCTWTGASSVDSNWSTPANWSGCASTVPSSGNTVVFPNGAARRSNNNDLAGLSLAAIVVTGPNYELGGNAIALGGNLVATVNSSVPADQGPKIGIALTLTAPNVWSCNGNRPLQVDAPVNLGSHALSLITACDVELAAPVGGSAGLTKELLGTLVLAADNTYTGTTVINNGILTVRHAGGIGAATVNAGGTLQLEADVGSGGALSLTGTVGGPSALRAVSGSSVWTGPVTLAGNAVIEVAAGAQLTTSGGVGGNASLTKAGAGRLELGSSNSYTGATLVSAGTLDAGSALSLGAAGQPVTVADGATLALQTDAYSGRTLTLDGYGVANAGALQGLGSDVVWAGPIVLADSASVGTPANATLLLSGTVSGGASLTKDGEGDVILSGANTYAGSTQVNAGTLLLTHPAGLGSTAGGTVVAAGATLALNTTLVTDEALTLNGSGAFDTGALRSFDASNAWTGPVTLATDARIGTDPGSTLTLSGVVGGGSGLTKTGTGTLTLAGNNSYGGHTTVAGGVLQIDTSGGLGAGTSAISGATVFSDSTLTLGPGVDVASEFLTLNGLGAAGAGALQTVSGSSTWRGPVTLASDTSVHSAAGTTLALLGNTDGAGALTKQGSGTLVLGGSNTYTGATNIGAGVLRLADPQALGATAGSTTIGAGARMELQGPLAIGNETLRLQGSGPDASGALHASGTLSWAGPWMLDGPATVAVASGSLQLAGGIPTMAPTLTKTGAGTLRYSGGAYTAPVFIDAGMLDLAADAIAVIVHVNDTGTLSGSGNANFVTLKDGGTVAPSGTLGMAYLSWQGGTIALRLGPTALGSDRLAVSGAVDKSGDGGWHFRFSDAPAGPPLAGVTYALAGYGGTSFATGDFSHSYNGVAGPNSLPGTIVAGSNQFTLVPLGVSLYRDGFEDAPP